MPKKFEPTVVLDGLIFPEGPRWHDDKLWFADIHAHKVYTWVPGGSPETVADLPNWPSGIGFSEDGEMIVSSMRDGIVYKLVDGNLEVLADLSGHGAGTGKVNTILNDLTTDGRGNTYVDIYGIDGDADNGGIALVRPDGKAEIVADGLAFPNTVVVTPDYKTLMVSETSSDVITAYDLDEDGRLSNKRLWARIPGATPDGMCLDAEGALWVGSAFTDHFYRVKEGGEILTKIHMPGKFTLAPVLGGPNGTTLYLMTCISTIPQLEQGIGDGFIESVEVDVPGAGWP
ncbi:SMP-30/gluconolactonase/LRE family protein [Nocardia sp. CA-120079]|uniref:SMP-30/gluconolactonase/LRE family protein n=1 Tax=Nocardia sp. CA-120079 TaxID=3239974 RepID=UPI003D960788